ncbi:MAG: TlpA family protein disulfide reductase [Myxococcales bacterium]|nr:TlpA family protein disulfide reductase [Myxococcales bacterium]
MSASGSKVNWPILAVGLGVTLPLMALLYAGFGKDPTALPDALTGDPAPTFRLVDIEGKEWALADLKGKPVFINFWSTWCGPCKVEHPMLLQAASAYPDVQFLGIIYSDEAKKVDRQMRAPPYRDLMATLDSAGIAYPNLDDPTGRAAIDYGVGGVPESFFVDRSGMVTFKQVGPLSPDIARRELDRISRQ